ncbi:MAG TPA: hypothetical protein PK718_00610 [Candidatus Methanofastidiosa archaeon]|nr:hypothetical protein [Candidatus Methanofastidiosa archaeon]
MKLYSVPLLVLLLMLFIETNEPTLSVDYNDTVIPGDTVTFDIMVENTTVNRCNYCTIYIDTVTMDQETLSHIDLISDPIYLPPSLESGEYMSGTISLDLSQNIPDGDYIIPLVFEGTLGDCDGGCYPFRVQHDYTITVTRNLPSLSYDCDRVFDFIGGLNAEIPMCIFNNGAGSARNLKLSIYGVIGGYISPDSFNTLESSESCSATIYVNTADLDPGIYDVGINIVYYDEYFKLYSDNVKLRIQVRPQRPQLEIEILNDERSVLINLKNEGGLKAIDIAMDVSVDGTLVFNEMIDEIGSASSMLIPIDIPVDIYGDVDMDVDISYQSSDGESFETNGEMFLNIPKNSSKSNRGYYILLLGVAIVCVSLILVRKKWVKRN